MNNPFSESKRLQKIGLQLEVHKGNRLNIIMKIEEQNYYNSDFTHLSLLKKLKHIEDEIRKLKSDEDYIRGTQTSDVVQNVFNEIDKLMSDFDDNNGEGDLISHEDWKLFRRWGK